MSGRRLGLVAALALVVLANAVVLAGVARNRAGTDARVELTERECPLEWTRDSDEDSGMALGLAAHWQDDFTHVGSPVIGPDALRQLGFDLSLPPADPLAEDFYRRALTRNAFVVLEMEGPAWKRWMAEEENRTIPLDLDWKRRMSSRLFVVAAGRDPAALRRRWPDRAHDLILPAKIRVSTYMAKGTTPAFCGTAEPLPDRLHVPLALRAVLDQVRAERAREGTLYPPKLPHYRLTLATGRRYEPWLEKVERLPQVEGAATPPPPSP